MDDLGFLIDFLGQFCQCKLPQPVPASVASTAVTGNHDSVSISEIFHVCCVPPAADVFC